MRTLFLSSIFLTLLVVGWSAENPSLLLSWGNDGQTNIQDTQIFNTFARVFGVPRVFSTDDESKSAIDLFNKPRGNLFFSLEGVAPDQTKLAAGSNKIVDVTPSVKPYSAFFTVASAVTGVSHNFLDFDSQNALYWTGNLFDALLQLHKKEFNILSASSCSNAAKLISPHRESFNTGSESLFWDEKTGSYSSIFKETSSFGIQRQNFPALFSALSSLLKSNSMNMEIKDRYIHVVNDDNIRVVFDQQEDEIFFAEILFVLNFGDIKTHPDWFSFYFKSAKMISDKYGEFSDSYLTAVSIIDLVIEDVIKKMSDKREYNYAVLYLPNAQPEIVL